MQILKNILVEKHILSEKRGRWLYVPAMFKGAAVVSKTAVGDYCMMIPDPFTGDECKALGLEPGFFKQVSNYYGKLPNMVKACELVAARHGR